MTIEELQLLLEIAKDCAPIIDADEALAERLKDQGLICADDRDYNRLIKGKDLWAHLTEKGQVCIDAHLALPLPVSKWVMP